MTTLSLRNSINWPPGRCGFLFMAVACVALSATALAQNTTLGTQANPNNSGTNNTALGYKALLKNTIGKENTAVGSQTLVANTEGVNNTATGHAALMGSIIPRRINNGSRNTGDGEEALTSIVDGNDNTATGYRALMSVIGSINNTAAGSQAMRYNSGSYNTAIGMEALRGATNPNNNQGGLNTATGYQALFSNAGGGSNTANGFSALVSNEWGWNNTATGYFALLNVTGSFNIGLGQHAGSKLTTGNYNIDIGNQGVAGEAQTIRIGDNNQKRTFIAGIHGVTTGDAASTKPVLIDSNGQLGTAPSSERFKKDITPMDRSSDAILQLKPVIFHYKNDNTNTSQFGLIAEQVEKVDPNLVIRDTDGKVDAVRYEAINTMLLNEFLKQHRRVEEQQKTITELKAAIAQQQKTLETLAADMKEQAAKITKVAARQATGKRAPRFVDSRGKAAQPKRHL